MRIVKKYIAKVVTIHCKIGGVYTLELESLGTSFKYEPGQFLHLALDEYDPSSQWPDSRCFSIQSSPGDELIKLTYAVIGDFTKRMQNELTVGKTVTLKLPYGNLFSQEYIKVNTVFISGGTGITPFLSLFTDSSFSVLQSPVLYAGFRNEDMNLYNAQIELAGRINPGLKVHLVYQDKDGILDIEKIYNDSHKKTSFFISGPPSMLFSFKNYLLNQGLSADQIKTDDWE
jgi:predicted ferric reductase